MLNQHRARRIATQQMQQQQMQQAMVPYHDDHVRQDQPAEPDHKLQQVYDRGYSDGFAAGSYYVFGLFYVVL